jgi:glycosyltransferase involved in cell wall biosynthesis
MRVLMTSDTFLPLVGGGEIHVREISEHLMRLGHHITLLTNQPREGDDAFPFKVIRIPWKRSNLFSLLRVLYQEVGKADLVHAHYSYRLSALTAIVAWVRRKPVIEILHGLGTLDEAGARFPYKHVHALYRFLALNLATRIISTSEDIAAVARKHIIRKGKIEIIFNGLDTSKFNRDVEAPESLKEKYTNRKIILTVRRLVPKNGIHFLVEAMPEITKRVPNALYLMVGTGRMEEYIRERVKDLRLEGVVEMVGGVGNSHVAGYMKLADVVVFPSTAESTSIACAEAMAMGKEIVASRVGGLVELLGEHNERGTLVKLVEWEGSDYAAPLTLPPERYEALAAAVCDALQGKTSGLGNKAEAFARRELDWKVVAEKTARVYATVLT